MINKTFPIAEKLISNGLLLSQTLYRQLQDETEILKQKQHADTLNSASDQKQRLINELNTFSQQLGQILETEKLPNNRAGLNAYFIKAENAGLSAAETSAKWNQITDISAKNQALNEQNGATIEILLRHTRQSLNILKGKPQTADTYGSDGYKKSAVFSSSIISV